MRDALTELNGRGVDVMGISPDTPAQQKNFDAKHQLGFPLLSDPEHRIAEAFDAWGEKRMAGKTSMGIIRSAFLVDENGTVAAAWYKVSPKDTVPNLLQYLDG